MREAGVESRVLILTSFAEGESVRDAVRAGVTGYLKDVMKAELLAAIRLAAERRTDAAPASAAASDARDR